MYVYFYLHNCPKKRYMLENDTYMHDYVYEYE